MILACLPLPQFLKLSGPHGSSWVKSPASSAALWCCLFALALTKSWPSIQDTASSTPLSEGCFLCSIPHAVESGAGVAGSLWSSVLLGHHCFSPFNKMPAVKHCISLQTLQESLLQSSIEPQLTTLFPRLCSFKFQWFQHIWRGSSQHLDISVPWQPLLQISNTLSSTLSQTLTLYNLPLLMTATLSQSQFPPPSRIVTCCLVAYPSSTWFQTSFDLGLPYTVVHFGYCLKFLGPGDECTLA